MKIFWSWQSDNHEKTGRYFVRRALNDAIKQLKEAEDVEEPNEVARKEALHADAGVEGLAGSVEIAREIFNKIANSAVFVADITPVGEVFRKKINKTPDVPGKKKKKEKIKQLMNPNVSIELGYAMGKLPENSFLTVMNTFYGDRSDTPFDLAGRSGTLMYELAPDATKEQIEAALPQMRGQFVLALREFLKKPAAPAEPFKEISTTANKATFWKQGEPLVRFEVDNAGVDGKKEVHEYRFNAPTALYLRVQPMAPLTEELKDITMKDAINKRPRVMTRTEYGCSVGRNAYGAIAYETVNEADLEGFVQVFRNGEIWCVSRDITRVISQGLVLPIHLMSTVMTNTLWKLLSLMNKYLEIAPPYRIVMGVVGIKGGRLGTGHGALSDIVHIDEVEKNCVVSGITEKDAQEAVDKFLEKLCDKADVTYAPQILSA